MEKLSPDRLQTLIGGSIAGGSLSVSLLFTGAGDLPLIIIKFIGVLIAAFTTGMVTLLGHDFYKYKIKPKIFKDGKEDKDQTGRAA